MRRSTGDQDGTGVVTQGRSRVATCEDASGRAAAVSKAQTVAGRQTPSATAAAATYSATSGPTRESNTDGTM